MNRLFGSAFDAQGNGGAAARWIPPMDLVEDGDEFVVRADIPGVDEHDVSVELDDNVLTISGERKSAQERRQGGYYRIERATGAFSRALTLPEGIDPDSIKANFDNGVLELRVPKPEQRKPRRVTINTGEKQPVIEGKS
ncbi:MAG: Hsp20/alpha crystallin family protein [Solirubrobacteraceae bacterium]